MNDFLKEALSHDWIMKYITEFIGTALMVALGNGSVANVELKGTKGSKSGWLVIGFGYGFAVMMPALMFGDVLVTTSTQPSHLDLLHLACSHG